MEKLDSKELEATRRYIQDIALVLGKVQQLFLPPHPNDWQKGLEVNEFGLSTPELPGTGTRVSIDFKRGDVSNGQTAWKLGDYTATELLDELGNWAMATGAKTKPEAPKFSEVKRENYDSAQASRIGEMLPWASAQLATLQPILLTGVVSPILLYPHHFDLSLVWFPIRRNEADTGETRQVGFGFSFGDEYISEAYFYTTAWPEPKTFPDTVLPEPAYWQKKGFSGAVLKYNDSVGPAGEQTVRNFLMAAAEGGRNAFGA